MSSRKRIEDLNWDEVQEELLIDYETEIRNQRAFEESVKEPTQIYIDMVPLTANLDLFRSRVRKPLLRGLAQTLQEENPDNVFYFREARFTAQAETASDAQAFLRRVNRRLANAVITLRTKAGNLAIFSGLGFSYGIGINADDAEDALLQCRRGLALLPAHYLHRAPDCLPDVFRIMEADGAFVSLDIPGRQSNSSSYRA